MYVAKVWYEGIAPGDRIVVLNDEFVLVGVHEKKVARERCNRITSRGVRIGSWFIPAHRIISVLLKEAKDE